jgi:hypothetical protein
MDEGIGRAVQALAFQNGISFKSGNTLKFKNRNHYIDWVYRSFVNPLPAWNSAFPLSSPIFTPKTFSPSEKTALVASMGLGVTGGLQIGMRRPLQSAVVWIAASDSESRALKELLVDPVVAVVPYPLDERKLKSVCRRRGSPSWFRARKRFFKKHGLDPAVPTFYFCGRITPSKGVHHLVRLAEKQKIKIQLVVAGMREETDRFPGEEAEAWRTTHRSPCCRTVNLGRIGRVRNYLYLSFVDSCVAVSTDPSEDFGFLPRQALALGTPVLITNWGGLNDIHLPAKTDSRFIRRFSVKSGRKGTLEPDFSGFGLGEYTKKISTLRDSERRNAGVAFLGLHSAQISASLRKAAALRKKLMGNARSRHACGARFRSISRDIILRSASLARIDSASCFPRNTWLRIMTHRD